MYSRISLKIYDEILPEKLGGDLYPSHRIEKIFSSCQNNCTYHVNAAADKFVDDDTVYTDDDGGGIMLTFCIQYKSSITTCDVYTCQ